MFEKLLIEQAAPTLAGIKPASLLPYCADSLEHAFNEIAEWDRKLSVSGIRIMALCSCEEKNRVLVYSYRITALNKLLSDGDTMDFLAGCGLAIPVIRAAKICSGSLLCVPDVFQACRMR